MKKFIIFKIIKEQNKSINTSLFYMLQYAYCTKVANVRVQTKLS